MRERERERDKRDKREREITFLGYLNLNVMLFSFHVFSIILCSLVIL